VDLDNDGRKDLVAGSFGGQIYWLRNGEKGFRAEETLKDAKGGDVTLTEYYDHKKKEYTKHEKQPFAEADGSAQTAEDRAEFCRVLDWNQDGLLDLLIVGSGGGLYIRLQQKSEKAPVFAELNQVLRDKKGKPMVIPGHHPATALFDWDGDGRDDLVTTTSAGGKSGLAWFRNTGTAKAPAYEPLQVLVEGFTESVTGIDFYDVDGDGVADLVIGDYKGEILWQKRTKAP
jgi:hypothetical protein